MILRVRFTLLKVPILLKPAKDAGSNKDLEKDLAEKMLGFFTPTTASATAIDPIAGKPDGARGRTRYTRVVR